MYEDLRKAVTAKNLEEVKALLAKGHNPRNLLPRHSGGDCFYGETFLHITSCTKIAKELLSYGAVLNVGNNYKETALHYAIRDNKGAEFVKLLLEHGADVNAQDRKGNNALNYAAKKTGIENEVVEELLKYGGDINLKNYEEKYGNCRSPLENSLCWNYNTTNIMLKYTLLKNFEKPEFRNYTKIIADCNISRNKKEIEIAVKNFLDKCTIEIVQMKTDYIIKDKFSLYKLVTNKNIDRIILHNNKIVKTLSKVDYSEYYPIYNTIILDKLKPIFERSELLDKINLIQIYAKSYENGNKKKIFLDDSKRIINQYLSNEDLSNLLKVFDEEKEEECIDGSGESTEKRHLDSDPDSNSNVNNNKQPKLE